jgi:hypothetical protein
VASDAPGRPFRRAEALMHMLGLFQQRVCERLRCDVSELSWRGGLDLTDDEVAERIAGLPIPDDAAVVVARVTRD